MSDSEGLLVGWASTDITPVGKVSLCGQFHMRISDDVKDPVTATALCVSSGRESFIMVSCDLVFITEAMLEQCRRLLKRLAPEIPSAKLIMNATHTHTAPDPWGFWYPPVPEGVMAPEEYRDFLAGRVAAVIVKSWNSRKPGFVAWGSGYAVASHNRRAVYFDDLSKRPGYSVTPGTRTERNARMYGDTGDPQFSGVEGYVDHGVNLLYTFDARRRLTGAVFNVHCPSQETEGMESVSADFWHEVRTELRKRHGKGLFLLPQCAPSGDLSPHLIYNKRAEERMLKLKGVSSRQEIASRLAVAFDDTLQWAKTDMRDSAELKHVVKKIKLSRRFITDVECRDAKRGLASLESEPPSSDPDPKRRFAHDSFRHSCKFRCRRIIERYEEQRRNPCIPVELHVVRFGDVAFASNPFELFLDYGLRIAARSPAVQSFLVQLANGTCGYLPTERAVQGGGYSACLYCNEVGPEGGQQLVEETLKAMKKLWSGK